MTHDAYLHLVARAKARDMARRDYFNHVDPDGIGPNRVIGLTGYRLPAHYSKARDGNNVESIAAGTTFTPKLAFDAWMKSPGHRRHLLATDKFSREQTRFGVGYFKSNNRLLRNYYVFVSAPRSISKPEPLTRSKISLFLENTPKKIKRLLAKNR